MSELRAATRQSTARTGLVEFDGTRGTISIPCTIAVDGHAVDERSGRWRGTGKVECGLHAR